MQVFEVLEMHHFVLQLIIQKLLSRKIVLPQNSSHNVNAKIHYIISPIFIDQY